MKIQIKQLKGEASVYTVYKDQKLGQGQFGTVFFGRIEENQLPVAIKQIKSSKIKSAFDYKYLIREKEINKTIKHQNIVQFYEFIMTNKSFYFVFEYCNEGTLLEKLNQSLVLNDKKEVIGTTLSSELIKSYLFQMISVLNYLQHKSGEYEIIEDGKKVKVAFKSISHRDLKLENIFLLNGQIKIGDFGISCLLDGSEITLTKVGTQKYVSPQLLINGTYNAQKNDVWSVGIIGYYLSMGRFPWQQLNKALDLNLFIHQEKININKKEKKYHFPIQDPRIDKQLSNIINDMLQFSEDLRPTFEELYENSYFEDQNEEIKQLVNNFQKQRILFNKIMEIPLIKETDIKLLIIEKTINWFQIQRQKCNCRKINLIFQQYYDEFLKIQIQNFPIYYQLSAIRKRQLINGIRKKIESDEIMFYLNI